MPISPHPVLIAFWQRLPLRQLLPVVLLLFVMKERYPFSHFPMYSNVDEEADIVYVTDEADRAVPMDAIFRTGSGTAKKMYKKELSAITKAAGRKLEDATSDERAAAGRAVMATMMGRIQSKAVPTDAAAFRLYRKTFRMEGGGLAQLDPERLAETPLTTP